MLSQIERMVQRVRRSFALSDEREIKNRKRDQSVSFFDVLALMPEPAPWVQGIAERREPDFDVNRARILSGGASDWQSKRVNGSCLKTRVCYTISFKHIPSKKACSFPKNMSGIWPVK